MANLSTRHLLAALEDLRSRYLRGEARETDELSVRRIVDELGARGVSVRS